MADSRFSLDEILNDYPRSSKGKKEDLIIDDIVITDKQKTKQTIPTEQVVHQSPPVKSKSGLSEDTFQGNLQFQKKSSKSKPKKIKKNSELGILSELSGEVDIKKAIHDSDKLSFELAGVKPIAPHKMTGNTEMIDNLMRLKKERGSRTSMVRPVERKSISDIDLHLEDKILPDTEQIPAFRSSEDKKLEDLNERRKKKIEEFVFIGEEEETEQEEPEENEEISDFESFDDTSSILKDMKQLKRSLTIRFVILLILSAMSLTVSVLSSKAGDVPKIFDIRNQTTTVLFIFILLGFAAAFVSYTVIYCGITKLFSLKGDGDSLSALAVISSLITAVISIAVPDLVQRGYVTIYISSAIFCLLFNTIGKLLIVYRTERNFQYVSGDYERYAMYTIEDEADASKYTRGLLNDFPVLASMKKVELVTDFLKSSYSSDLTDKFCLFAAPGVAAAGLIIAVISAIMFPSVNTVDKVLIGLSSLSATYSICACMGIMLVVSYPMNKVSKRNQEYSSAMLSYDGIEEFADTNSVLIDAAQLFPQGMVKLLNIKTFSNTRIDEAIIEAASLTNQAGSILKSMFYDIIVGKTEMLNPVESYTYEDSLGLCGWINNRRVLLGNRELMLNHSIEGLPAKNREREYTESGGVAVYLSISGELSAMFVIEMKAGHEIRSWLKRLERNSVYVILRTVDSVVSITKLAELFDISPEMLKLLPFRLHPNFEEDTSYIPEQSASFVCNGRFPSFAALIIRAKKIRAITHMGITIQAASAILGFILMVILTLTSALPELTALLVVLYGIAWTIFTVIMQTLRKL